jgi:hypothetical protein
MLDAGYSMLDRQKTLLVLSSIQGPESSICSCFRPECVTKVDTNFEILAYVVPERKVMFRQNPNIVLFSRLRPQIRNAKQILIPNDKMT